MLMEGGLTYHHKMGGPLGDLPGLTYDPIRNRYFSTPAESKPRRKKELGASSASRLASSTDDRRTKRRRGQDEGSSDPAEKKLPGQTRLPSLVSGLTAQRTSRTYADSFRLQGAIHSHVYASLQRHTDADEQPMPCALTALSSVPGRDGMVVGDQSGCVYGVKTEGDHPGSRSRWVWQDINLGRKVNNLHHVKEGYIATTFGPNPRMVISPLPPLLQDFNVGSLPDEDRAIVVWEMAKLRDAWGSTYADGSITIGGDHQIVYAKDVYNPAFRAIPTPGLSDAMAVQQINSNEAVVGLRSGQICHYDFRLENSKAASRRFQTSTATNLHVFPIEFGGGRSLLTAGYKNELAMYDLRFAAAQPVCLYSGHINDVRSGLGFAVTPNGSHVYAAGADRQIRCWDVRSGQRLRAQDAFGHRWGGAKNPLTKRFETQVTGLEVAQSGLLNVLHGPNLEVFTCGKLDSWTPATYGFV